MTSEEKEPVALVPYQRLLGLPEDERVLRRVDELRPLLEAAKKNVDAGGSGRMEMHPISWDLLAPPRFVYDLINLLDRSRIA